VREGFLAVARDLGERATVVDANGSADEVAAQILGVLERL
jgi:thymidylate kinase